MIDIDAMRSDPRFLALPQEEQQRYLTEAMRENARGNVPAVTPEGEPTQLPPTLPEKPGLVNRLAKYVSGFERAGIPATTSPVFQSPQEMISAPPSLPSRVFDATETFLAQSALPAMLGLATGGSPAAVGMTPMRHALLRAGGNVASNVAGYLGNTALGIEPSSPERLAASALVPAAMEAPNVAGRVAQKFIPLTRGGRYLQATQDYASDLASHKAAQARDKALAFEKEAADIQTLRQWESRVAADDAARNFVRDLNAARRTMHRDATEARRLQTLQQKAQYEDQLEQWGKLMQAYEADKAAQANAREGFRLALEKFRGTNKQMSAAEMAANQARATQYLGQFPVKTREEIDEIYRGLDQIAGGHGYTFDVPDLREAQDALKARAEKLARSPVSATFANKLKQFATRGRDPETLTLSEIQVILSDMGKEISNLRHPTMRPHAAQEREAITSMYAGLEKSFLDIAENDTVAEQFRVLLKDARTEYLRMATVEDLQDLFRYDAITEAPGGVSIFSPSRALAALESKEYRLLKDRMQKVTFEEKGAKTLYDMTTATLREMAERSLSQDEYVTYLAHLAGMGDPRGAVLPGAVSPVTFPEAPAPVKPMPGQPPAPVPPLTVRPLPRPTAGPRPQLPPALPATAGEAPHVPQRGSIAPSATSMLAGLGAGAAAYGVERALGYDQFHHYYGIAVPLAAPYFLSRAMMQPSGQRLLGYLMSRSGNKLTPEVMTMLAAGVRASAMPSSPSEPTLSSEAERLLQTPLLIQDAP